MALGIMLGVEAAGASTFSSVISAQDLGRGAIIGAMFVGAAFLAGIGVLKNSAAAFCGFLMIAAGLALTAISLGILPAPSPSLALLLQGVFAASVLVFLSATLPMVARSQFIGGILFAGALTMVGIGIINLLFDGHAAGAERLGLAAVAVTVLALTGLEAMRGDAGARLVLPGAALAIAAAFLASFEGLSLLPEAIFAAGVLIASLVGLAEPVRTSFGGGKISAPVNKGFDAGVRSSYAAGQGHQIESPREASALRVSENQLAQVLDYAGVAVWDWSRDANHQTESFCSMMGADCDGAFTPGAMRDFIHKDDIPRFEKEVFGAGDVDGGFDEVVRLQTGKSMRFRGARAIDSSGALERVIVFLEDAHCVGGHEPARPDSLKLAAATLTSAALSAADAREENIKEVSAAKPARVFQSKEPPKAELAADNKEIASGDLAKDEPVATNDAPAEKNVADAIADGEIKAAFQPILSLEDSKQCGAEALLRWGGDTATKLTTEEIVAKAHEADKGKALAMLMLDAAADHIAEKVKAGDKKYFAAFNASASQLSDRDFVSAVSKAIKARKLPKKSLVIEVTEAEKLSEEPKTASIFKALRNAGAALAYDDFGAGFSSLSNLHKYDFDYLKIDKSFIDDIVANGGKKKIASALARLGRDFGMTVIAEGVQSKEAAEIARSIGCKMGQGFHLGEPALKSALGDKTAAAQAGLPTAEAALQKGDLEAEGDFCDVPLDRNMDAPRPASRSFRRRLFGASAR